MSYHLETPSLPPVITYYVNGRGGGGGGGYQWHNGELAKKISIYAMKFDAILCHFMPFEIWNFKWTENLITNYLHPTSTVHLYLYLLYYNIYFHPLISSKYP